VRPLRVLIAGAGVGALEATLALRRLADDLVDIELLAPEDEFVYRPMSVAEPFRQGEVRRFPLDRLVESAGARLRRGTLEAVHVDKKTASTADGDELAWDVLLLALGARQVDAIPGAQTFRGQRDRAALAGLLDEAAGGLVRSIVFALPTQAAWPLPLYELALMTKLRLTEAGTSTSVELVTPEARPLGIFGERPTASLEQLLATRGIRLHTQTTPVAFRDGSLVVVPGLGIRADRAVALPAPAGWPIPGLPQDARGFVRTDAHGRVERQVDVYAVGDMTAFPLKQGGLAAQQADAAAESIAAVAGAPVTPEPFRPVLRGLLLTGLTPQYFRASLLDAASEADSQALWWPPGKIVGRYLSPFLASQLGIRSAAPTQLPPGALNVDVELERSHADWAPSLGSSPHRKPRSH
jgi:sulfide:quinone oxidoreductase